MRYIVLALAFCFALSPLEAAPKAHSNSHAVKAKRGKVKGRKPSKRQSSHGRAN
jgi:hypothetical protein